MGGMELPRHKPTRRALAAVIASILIPGSGAAQRKPKKVKAPRSRMVMDPGHPVPRAARFTVLVRPARRVVPVAGAIIYLSTIPFAAVAMAAPPAERLSWQDTETIHLDEEWVDCNFGVDERGGAVFLQVDGQAQLAFADVAYENGEVQVVDFEERIYANKTFRLYEIPGLRNVRTVRLLARARSEVTTLRLYLSR